MSADSAPGSPLPSRWLLFRLSALGDAALSTGPMRYWHERRGWTFTVLTRAVFAPLFAHNPAVESVIGLEREDLAPGRFFSFLRRLAAKSRGMGLLDLHGTPRSRLLGLLWQGPVCRSPKFSLERRIFVRHKFQALSRRLRASSVTQRYALAVEKRAPEKSELLPVIYLQAAEKVQAGEALREIFGPNAAAPLALHPYATHTRKTWPRAYWLELIRALDGLGLNWFIVGRGEALLPGDRRDLSNRTDLRRLCALLAQARLLLSGDSGPLHLAAAVNTPVLALFGPTTAEWGFFPAGPGDLVLEKTLDCRPCSLHGAGVCGMDSRCLKEITVRELLNTLSRTPGHTRLPL
jgi:ADP-heptose:LPS heptosyltransferase